MHHASPEADYDVDSEPAYRALATLSFAVEKTRPAGTAKLQFGDIIANAQHSILEKKRAASVVAPRAAHVNMNRLLAEDYLTFDLTDDADDEDWKPLEEEAASPGPLHAASSPKSFSTDSQSYRALQQGTAMHAPRFSDRSMSNTTSSNPVIAAIKAKKRLMHDLDKQEPVPSVRVPSLSCPRDQALSPTSQLSQPLSTYSSGADLLLDQLQAATSPHKQPLHARRSSILGLPSPSSSTTSPSQSPAAAAGAWDRSGTASAPLPRPKAFTGPRDSSSSSKELELLAVEEEQEHSPPGAGQRAQRVRHMSLMMGPGCSQGRPARPPALLPALGEGPGPGPRAPQDPPIPGKFRRNSVVGLASGLRSPSPSPGPGAPSEGAGSFLRPSLSHLSAGSLLSKQSGSDQSHSGPLIKVGLYESVSYQVGSGSGKGGDGFHHSHSGPLRSGGQQEVAGGDVRRAVTAAQPGEGGEGGEGLRLPTVGSGRKGRGAAGGRQGLGAGAGSGRSSPVCGGSAGGDESGGAAAAQQRSDGLMSRLKMWVKGGDS